MGRARGQHHLASGSTLRGSSPPTRPGSGAAAKGIDVALESDDGFNALFGSSRGNDSAALDTYTVTIQCGEDNANTIETYQMVFQAEDTGHAREQALDHLGVDESEAISNEDGDRVLHVELGGESAETSF